MNNMDSSYPHSHRSWFPFILMGLSLALLAIIFVVRHNNDQAAKLKAVTDAELQAAANVPTNAEYEAALKSVLVAYDADQNASVAYTSLIAMTVPQVSYQTAHLDLVIAFAQLQAGQAAEGKTRLDLARSTYAWLK